MPTSYFHGDSVFVDGIDLKRVARCYRQSLLGPDGQPTKNLEQALEDMSKSFGFESYHALRAEARHSQETAHRNRQPYLVFAEEALTHGMRFPKALPERFSKAWQEQAITLFKQAMKKRDPSRLEFIALVGSEGCGKTMLARHMVKLQGGALLDATLTSTPIPDSSRVPDAVLVYDRPTRLPECPAGFSYRNDGSYDIDHSRQQLRSSFNPFGMFNLYSRLRNEIQQDRGCHFVVVLPAEADVLHLLTSVINPGIQGMCSGSFIWQAGHVVNLDTMQFSTILPPSFEEWAEKQEATRKAASL